MVDTRSVVDNHVLTVLASACHRDLMVLLAVENRTHCSAPGLEVAQSDSMDLLLAHTRAVEHSKEEHPVFHLLFYRCLCSNQDSLVVLRCSEQQLFLTRLFERRSMPHMGRCWREVADDNQAMAEELHLCLAVHLAHHPEDYHSNRLEAVLHSIVHQADSDILVVSQLAGSQMVGSQAVVNPVALLAVAPHSSQKVEHHNSQKVDILVVRPSCRHLSHR